MKALLTENGTVILALMNHIRKQMERLDSNEIFQKGKDDKRDLYKRLEGKIEQTLNRGDIKPEEVNNLILETATISHHRRRRTRDKCLFFIGVEAESWKAFKKMVNELQPNIQDAQLTKNLISSLKVNENKMKVSSKDGMMVFGYDRYRQEVLQDYRDERASSLK